MRTQAARQHRQIEHQRGVGEDEVAQVTITSVCARIARVGAWRRRPWVDRSSSPRQRRVGGLSSTVDDVPEPTESDPCPARSSRLITLEPMVTADDVTDALRDVIDPELGLDFVELGLIYGVDLDGGAVHVSFTLTSPGCPIGPQISEQIQEFVGQLDGVEDVQSTMTFSPPWTSERMSEDAKFALGF